MTLMDKFIEFAIEQAQQNNKYFFHSPSPL